MRFKRIKVKDGKINIEYEVKKEEGVDEFSLLSVDKALPSFHEALQALAQDVVEICELPEKDKDVIVVSGVSFSYGGDAEVMGATIIAVKKLLKSNNGLNLNTPHKPSEPYTEEGDHANCLSEDCVKRLTTLQEEAEGYVKGKGAQGDLFAESAKEAA